MPNALDKIRRAAVAMTRKNPRLKYQQALKRAGREYRQGKIGRVPKNRKVGTKPRKAAKARYVPVKAEHCKKIGAVADPTLAQSLALTRKKLVARLGWAMVNRDQAKTTGAYNKYADEVSSIRKKLNALR